ncbi:MAG: FlgD immunoglobulin-like domain containing protein [candidate division WOR-3 bacterium]
MKHNKKAMSVMAAAVVALTVVPVHGANRALIIQAFHPEEGLDFYSNDKMNALWNDTYLMFELLDTAGAKFGHLMRLNAISEDRIHVLYANGQDWEEIRRPYYVRYDPRRRLGLPQITDDTCRIDKVKRYLEAFAHGDAGLGIEPMTANDTLFIYTWGHGGHDSTWPNKARHFSIYVRPIYTHLWDTTFGRLVRQIPAQKIIVMQQCFSGGFIDDMADSTTTILCASPAGKKAFAADNDSKNGSPLPEFDPVSNDTSLWHSEFNFHFMNAMRGMAIWPYHIPPEVDADVDNDGFVSWGEAYHYVELCDSYRDRGERPVFFNPDSPWVAQPYMPLGPSNKPVDYSGALAAQTDTVSTHIYALQGNKTREFWVFNVNESTWRQLPDVPLGSNATGVRKGGTLAATWDGRLFATKGNNTVEFYEYTLADSHWQERDTIPRQPSGKRLKNGTASTAVTRAETAFIYLLKGNGTTDFYRFNTLSGHWEMCASAPSWPDGKGFKDGSSIAWDGGDYIYALKGDSKNNLFYRYSLAKDSWESLSGMPLVGRSGRSKRVKAGAALAFCDDWLYALKGGNTRELWVYVPDGRFWFQGEDVPPGPKSKKVKSGGALIEADGLIWVLKGGKTSEFYCFVPNLMHINAPQPQPQPPVPSLGEALVVACENAEHPRWSPSGRWIVYSRPDATGNLQLWKVAATGGAEMQLTCLPGDCENPTWSPDESRIAFQLSVPSTANSQIAVLDLATGSVSILTSDERDHEYPEWSPTGATIYCVRWSGDGSAVCSVSRSGGYVQHTDDGVDRESPNTASADAITSEAVFVRPDGIYRTTTAQRCGSQSAGIALLALEDALPNPARERVTICWQIPKEGGVSLRVYNTAGQMVRTLASGRKRPGANSTVWDMRDSKGRLVADGVYFYSLETEGKRLSRKLVLER